MIWWRRRTKARSAVETSALEQIMRLWSVDQADVTPHENGFDWLPGNHMVEVRIHKDIEARGPERFRLTISTDYLRDLPAQDASFVRKASLTTKHHCPMYSLAYPPRPIVENAECDESAAMFLFSSAYVSRDTVGWLPRFLAAMSIMQPIEAESLAASASVSLGCKPALAAERQRKRLDDILGADHALRLMGDEPSRWIGSPEFEAFALEHARNDICFGHGDEHGLQFETPLGSDSALVNFRTDRPSPTLGNGLFIETKIRTFDDLDSVCALAAQLNYLESVDWSDFPQMGCWHPLIASNDDALLAHSCFIPNLLFDPGLVVNFGLWAIGRVQRIAPALGISANLTMREILEQRFGPDLAGLEAAYHRGKDRRFTRP